MEINLVNIDSSWLFLLTDEANESQPSVFLSSIGQGHNAAFLFNTSSTTSSSMSRMEQLSCLARVLFELYSRTLYQVIRAEEERYFKTNEEQWLSSKPSTSDRNNEAFRVFQVNSGPFRRVEKFFSKIIHY